MSKTTPETTSSELENALDREVAVQIADQMQEYPIIGARAKPEQIFDRFKEDLSSKTIYPSAHLGYNIHWFYTKPKDSKI